MHIESGRTYTREEPPFTNGLHGDGWVKRFKKRYHDLSLRMAQGLEQAKAKRLCLVNVTSL